MDNVLSFCLGLRNALNKPSGEQTSAMGWTCDNRRAAQHMTRCALDSGDHLYSSQIVVLPIAAAGRCMSVPDNRDTTCCNTARATLSPVAASNPAKPGALLTSQTL